jgi:hypothetical protein
LPNETDEFSIAEGSDLFEILSQKSGREDIKKGIEKIIIMKNISIAWKRGEDEPPCIILMDKSP